MQSADRQYDILRLLLLRYCDCCCSWWWWNDDAFSRRTIFTFPISRVQVVLNSKAKKWSESGAVCVWFHVSVKMENIKFLMTHFLALASPCSLQQSTSSSFYPSSTTLSKFLVSELSQWHRRCIACTQNFSNSFFITFASPPPPPSSTLISLSLSLTTRRDDKTDARHSDRIANKRHSFDYYRIVQCSKSTIDFYFLPRIYTTHCLRVHHGQQ